MTTLKENDEVFIVGGEFILAAMIEPLDTKVFSAFLFKKAAIDTSDSPLPFHICIDPDRLQLATP